MEWGQYPLFLLLRGEKVMTSEELHEKEDRLASWRLASLLAFNGLLLTAVPQYKPNTNFAVEWFLPICGFAISFSVLWVSIESALVKFCNPIEHESSTTDERKDTKSKLLDIPKKQFLGPYILSGILLSIFWALFISINLVKIFC